MTWTFVDRVASGNETQIGTDVSQTLESLVNDLTSSMEPRIRQAAYTFNGVDTLNIQAKLAGAIGGDFTLASSSDFVNFKTQNPEIERLVISLNLKTDQVPVPCAPGNQILVASSLVSPSVAGKILRYDAASGAFIDDFVPNCSSVDPSGDCSSVPGAAENPVDMAYGADQKLYIADTPIGSFGFAQTGIAVKRYNGTNGVFEDFLDSFSAFVHYGENGLEQIGGLVFGPDSNLYVSDSITGAILRYHGQTGDFLSSYVSSGSLQTPGKILFGPDGNLYVIENGGNRVLRFQGPFGTNPGLNMGEFVKRDDINQAISATFSSDGSLYISGGDGSNYFVHRYQGPFALNPGTFIDSIDLPDGVIPSQGGLAFGLNGNLYISSIGENTGIFVFDPKTNLFTGKFASIPSPSALLFSSVPELPQPSALGDFNGDGCIDRVNDIKILINAIRSKSTDKKFDLNGDGLVNIADARKLTLLFSEPRGANCP